MFYIIISVNLYYKLNKGTKVGWVDQHRFDSISFLYAGNKAHRHKEAIIKRVQERCHQAKWVTTVQTFTHLAATLQGILLPCVLQLV